MLPMALRNAAASPPKMPPLVHENVPPLAMVTVLPLAALSVPPLLMVSVWLPLASASVRALVDGVFTTALVWAWVSDFYFGPLGDPC